VNVMRVLHFEYLQSNLVCDPNVGIAIYIFLIQFYFYDPNVSIANFMFISMTNKYQNMSIASSVLMIFYVYKNIVKSFFYMY
jgi:hypothetical protein